MECEWVLRAGYGLSRTVIGDLLAGLLVLEHIDAQEPESVAEALAAYAQGMDFADALHALAARPQRFATFDKALQRQATRLGWRHVVAVR